MRMRMGACVAALILAGCAGTGLREAAFVDTSALPQLAPKAACAALAGSAIAASAIGLPTSGAKVLSAALVPAAAEHVGPASVVHALPEYCKVLGEILPVDPAAPPIRFQLNVPTQWNGKAIHVGGGGLDGVIPPNLAAIGAGGSPISAAFPPDAPYPLSRGYAMYGSDSGHQDPGTTATWALNDEAWLNFAHAALKKTHDASFAVLQALYGAKPRVSYFMGQSQGGREALEVAQRYPDDYDGVVATSPLIGYSAHVIHKTLLAAMQTGAGWIPPAKHALIGAEVLRQCDALDGLADGVISNYRACAARFDPRVVREPYAAIRCPGGADTGNTCVSDAQIATLNRMHAPLRFDFALANGWTEFPGYEVGREAMPGWLAIAPQPRNGTQPALGQPGATVSYGILKDPAFQLAEFTVAPFADRIRAASALIDTTNPDLARFFARGGRMIIKVQGSDYASNPHTVMRYHDLLVQRFGRPTVDRHVRLYVLPNGDHGGVVQSATSAQPLPRYVDLITLATDWVEKGAVPPDAPVVKAQGVLPPYTVSATRPLCRYPLYPNYAGGDAHNAASFRCVAE